MNSLILLLITYLILIFGAFYLKNQKSLVTKAVVVLAMLGTYAAGAVIYRIFFAPVVYDDTICIISNRIDDLKIIWVLFTHAFALILFVRTLMLMYKGKQISRKYLLLSFLILLLAGVSSGMKISRTCNEYDLMYFK